MNELLGMATCAAGFLTLSLLAGSAVRRLARVRALATVRKRPVRRI